MLTFTSLLFRHFRISYVHIFRGMNHKVFVYGTLKRDQPNHHWLTDPENGFGKFLTEGKTKNKYPLIIATKYNIPFVLHSPGDGLNVKGEVYEVDNVMLGRLDILEDHPNYYEREVDDIIITSEKGEQQTIKCWIYFLKKFKKELLKRPMMDSYSSRGSHGLPYLESNELPTYEDFYKVIRDEF
ncbi:putative gamma-glutamylcyclotransferase CG2811 isoform X3 [Pectinophora gossypiella]|uniref:putative gamma-glutamylcyclotransferase CG2811 isoform X3 n=1 Tax=Pectinophora gossypiella TaxID=13191 RepID=UPI00214EA15A|nr:putative gamma-glutamylcyclotransferase CG2811 isoform X3 [Pectinophora gossypiella]